MPYYSFFDGRLFKELSSVFKKKTSLACAENCPISGHYPNCERRSSGQYQQKVFSVLKELIYFGEKPYASTDYRLLNSFIGSYEQLQKNTEEGFKLGSRN
jgi:hypothetical protein